MISLQMSLPLQQRIFFPLDSMALLYFEFESVTRGQYINNKIILK